MVSCGIKLQNSTPNQEWSFFLDIAMRVDSKGRANKKPLSYLADSPPTPPTHLPTHPLQHGDFIFTPDPNGQWMPAVLGIGGDNGSADRIDLHGQGVDDLNALLLPGGGHGVGDRLGLCCAPQCK